MFSIPLSFDLTDNKAESPNTIKDLIPKSIAALRPKIQASYPAMLLVQLKQSLAVKGVWQPYGEIITMPIPFPSVLEAPSKYRVHRDPC